ncbi:MAG: hypothetical protein HYV09_23075 [Deltaproteobacteria bacterium]|nr:hypothetical protein [Deltaproteobacteria bacterium]
MLIVLGIVGVVVGFLQWTKMKKILAAPFKKTGEIAANPQVADAKGMISCEGAVQVQQPLVAPCSGKPCLYYEIKVERMWEKQENTEDGVKTKKGTSTVTTTEVGSQFYVNDGSGPVGVDAREKVDTELTKSFEQAQNVSYGDLVFGSYQCHVPYSGGDEHTTGVRAIEKILPADGNVFVMGKLAGGVITKQDGMLGKVIVSTKGRDALVGATKRNAMLGFILGGVVAVGGIPAGLLIESGPDTCANLENAMKDGTCSDRVSTNAGKTYTWKVTKEGAYKLTVAATGKSATMKLWPKLTVTTADGKEVGEDGSESGESAKVLAYFEKGTYTVKVADISASHIEKLKGGAGYVFDIKQATGAEADSVAKMKKGDGEEEADKKDEKAEEEKPAAEEKPAEKPAAKPAPKKK